MNAIAARLYSMTIDRLMADIRARVPDFCEMRAGDSVIDVCCGTGAQTVYYARRGITSWGIDVDPGMIEFAEKRRRKLGLDITNFVRASAGNLPFRDACFDHASVSMGLHEKRGPLRDRIVSEMKRVVKRNGTLSIVDYRVPLPDDAYGRVATTLEWVAGHDHYRCFRGFTIGGGLDSLVVRHRLPEEGREHPRRLPVVLLKLRNI